MGHAHSHTLSHTDNAEKNISVAFFLNAVFVVIELAGGLLTNSIAILTDALHDFGDCLSLATAWYFQKKSHLPGDADYSYGYKRFSLLGGVFLSGVLLISSIIVLFEAGRRLAQPEAVNAQGMLWLAIVGIIINGAAAIKVMKGSSLNERSVYLHIMEDVLGWVAVLIVSIVMFFVNLPILDPILSIAISIWVLSNVYKNLKATFRILLQATPEDIAVDKLKEEICAVEGIESIHDMHLWSLDGESHVMTLHVVSSSSEPETIRENILSIAKEYHISHTTLQFEKNGHLCLNNCQVY